MAERSQYQYQPITGPVWRAPVAESLSWFPRTQQPARALEYRRLGDFQQPPFDALYKPSDLAWQSHGTAPQIPLERRLLGDFQQPPFTSLYQPSGLQWQSVDRYYGKPLARAIVDFSVYPLQVQSTAYDPSTLEWIASGRYPQILVERRIRGDFQQPAFDALYRPENIQWLPQGKGTPTPTERRVLGDFQQPSFDALFKPEFLQWPSSDRYYGRPLPYSPQSKFVFDLRPVASVPVFSGTIPNFTEFFGSGLHTYALGVYFTGATSYAINPAIEPGWSFNVGTGDLTIDTDALGVFGPFIVTATNATGNTDSNGFTVSIVPMPAVLPDQPAGGWRRFNERYEQELELRRRRKKRQHELEEETQRIKDALDRQIAVELRRKERDEERQANLARLRAIAADLEAAEARQVYGDRVAAALERATLKGGFSALEALDRELQRAQEEEEFLLLAATMLLHED